jgi:hypothetical protein
MMMMEKKMFAEQVLEIYSRVVGRNRMHASAAEGQRWCMIKVLLQVRARNRSVLSKWRRKKLLSVKEHKYMRAVAGVATSSQTEFVEGFEAQCNKLALQL